MAKRVKAIVLITAGSNCDRETEYALQTAGADAERVHVNDLIYKDRELGKFTLLVIPGGFSFGDDIAAGKVFANKLRFRLGGEVERFYEEGKLIIGICNGFQVLAKIGLVPNISGKFMQEATLTYNKSGKFEDRWLTLKCNDRCPSVFTRGLPSLIQLPIAHGEGRFVPAEGSILKELKENHLIAFRYSDEKGRITNGAHNPNGSIEGIAGISDSSGRVLGMMPHPERYIHRYQHPQWCRANLPKDGVGLKIFRNAVNYIKNNL